MKSLKRFCNNVINYVTFNLFDKRYFLYYFKNDTSVIRMNAAKHLYFSCKSADIEFLYYNEKSKEIHFKTPDGVRVVTNQYFHIFIEIFCNKLYCQYEEHIRAPFTIIDAGANRGYSALYFASNKLCNKVYSYEPDTSTFAYIEKNLSVNPEFSKKIEAYNFGFSNKNDVLTFYQHGTTDGINSTDEDFLIHYDKKRKDQMKTTQITVKKASEEMGKIVASKKDGEQLFLKIDIEGAEYDVLQDLKDGKILQEFSVIFGECHKGFEAIEKICGDQFECVFLNKCHVDGLYNFLIVNKKK